MNINMLHVAVSALLLTSVADIGHAESTGRAPEDSRAAAPTAVLSGGCSDANKINYKSDDSINKSTFSSSFVDVPNSAVLFTQGGAVASCVIVTFTAEAFAPGSRLLQIRARLDNSVTAAPGNVQLSGDDDEDGDGRWARSQAFTFIFPSVAPGPHNVRMQFRSPDVFGNVYIHKHTIMVQHR